MVATVSLLPRLLAPIIREALTDTPVVCVVGPRQSGKTTLVQHLAPERAFFSLDENNYYQTAVLDPPGFVAALPDAATVDEVQRVPALLPAIKRAVDRDRRPGRFLLTGSANLLLVPTVTESLAGRMEIVQLQPLTEAEKERKRGGFLIALLEGALKPRMRPGTTAAGPALAERLVAGGYPEPLTRAPARARQWYRQYLRGIIERELDLSSARFPTRRDGSAGGLKRLINQHKVGPVFGGRPPPRLFPIRPHCRRHHRQCRKDPVAGIQLYGYSGELSFVWGGAAHRPYEVGRIGPGEHLFDEPGLLPVGLQRDLHLFEHSAPAHQSAHHPHRFLSQVVEGRRRADSSRLAASRENEHPR